jgi:hypothetical protein
MGDGAVGPGQVHAQRGTFGRSGACGAATTHHEGRTAPPAAGPGCNPVNLLVRDLPGLCGDLTGEVRGQQVRAGADRAADHDRDPPPGPGICPRLPQLRELAFAAHQRPACRR